MTPAIYNILVSKRYISRLKFHPEMCPNLRENIRCGECWYAALLVILHTQYVKCVGNITYNMELWKYYTPNICEMCWKYYIQYGDMEILHTQYLWNALEILHTTRSLGALRAPTSNWRPFGPFDFTLCALQALRPCDPRHSDWIVC